jgi:hypothetical protein
LNSRADLVNQSAVLGLFTWSDDPAYTHREIDVEVSRWNNPGDPNNSQFVVQPWDSVNHLVRYMVPAGLTNTTHLFTWETNRVWFQAQRGPFSPNPASSNVIRTWTYTAFMPRTGDENVRLNLWLNNGTPPTDNHEVEVIVKSFTFAPLSAPAPAELSNYSLLPDKRIRFEVTTEPDRRYVIQQASDSGVWQDVTSFLATNTWVPFSEPNAPHPTRRLFRAVTLP